MFVKQWADEGGATYFTMVATDGHRLSMIDRPFLVDIPAFREGVIIPRKGLSELKGLLEESEEPFDFGIAAGRVFARIGQRLLSIVLIDEAFPNYKQVIPMDSHRSLRVNRGDFMDALRRVSLLSDTETHSVILSAEKNRSVLTSANPQLGDAREEIDSEYAGEGFRLAFNASYAMDAMRSIEGEFVELSMNDPLAPCTIRGDADPGHLCVIMPMRID